MHLERIHLDELRSAEFLLPDEFRSNALGGRTELLAD
jgi:hypothetical protein